jgi:surface protein
MTDSTIQEAVDIWCSNPTLATKYYGPLAAWDTSNVTSFRGLFRLKSKFNDDCSQWDTSKVTSMAGMFEGATAFDQDLSLWDTSKVVSMSAMFADATSFTGTKNGNSLAKWNVEKVARMDRM